ncbi:hypothetical protein RYX36_016551, partial [Vicia faba]
ENHTTPSFKRFMDKSHGLMNKSKPLIRIEEDTDTTEKLILIKISIGNNVVESIINFALRHQANII